MHPYLCPIVLASALVVAVPMPAAAQADSMDFESASEVSRVSRSPQANQRRARGGLAASSIGLAAGLLGIVMGGVFLVQSNRTGCSPQSDVCQIGLLDPDVSRRTGTALLVVSPLVFGASVFGLVRSRRRLNPDKEPASWRRTRE